MPKAISVDNSRLFRVLRPLGLAQCLGDFECNAKAHLISAFRQIVIIITAKVERTALISVYEVSRLILKGGVFGSKRPPI